MAQNISWKDINRLAIPAIFAGIAEPVISIADTAIVGQLGTIELGAVGIGASFFSLVMWILAQTKSAISSIVSKAFGSKTLFNLQDFIPQALILNFLLGAIVFVVSVGFADAIFSGYNAEGQQKELCISYYQIRGWGLPISLVVFGIFGVFRGIQNTIWAMIISISAMVINIILDVLLVYGWEGLIPAMGIEGAALASVISQGYMLLAALWFLMVRANLKLKFSLQLNPQILKLLKMSFDLFLRAGALNLVMYLGTSLATKYGEAEIAAYTIGLNIWLFSAFFIDGFSSAGNAIAGRLAGEQNVEELKNVSFRITKTNLVIATGLALVYLIGYNFWPLFFTDDYLVVEVFKASFWVIILTQPINAIAFSLDGIFKGLGKTELLRNVLIGSSLLVFLPFVLVMDSFVGNLVGIWFAFSVWMIGRALPLYINLIRLKHVS